MDNPRTCPFCGRELPPAASEWVTLRQAATLLGVHKRTIYRHLDRLGDNEIRRTGAGYICVRAVVLDRLR
jgi:predicted DNA-binding transcriptional regulator YafY